jgi:fumarylacetoacetase
LQSGAMAEPATIARSNMRHLYWNVCQQLAHHTVGGCNMRPGDLLATGTISGPTPDSYGSLLELSWRGTRPLTLPNGETRTYLADGDRLTLAGWAQGMATGWGLVKCLCDSPHLMLISGNVREWIMESGLGAAARINQEAGVK